MPTPASSWAERRAWPRRRNPFRVFLANPLDRSEPPADAWIVDRSPGGLRLAMDQEIAAGTVFKVRPIAAPAAMPWIAVEVRNCRQQESGWELGCKFLQPVSLTTLLLFG